METRRILVLKRIARENLDARRLRAALEPTRNAATGEVVPPARQFTATGKAFDKVPPPPTN